MEKKVKVPTANVEISCPLLNCKTKVACYDTEFDVVIGNVSDAKCFCSISEKSKKMNDSFQKLQRKDSTLSKLFKRAEKGDEEFKIVNNVLCKINSSSYERICIPKKLRIDILRLGHDNVLGGGHLGIKKTINRITKEFYWPNIYKEVKKYCLACAICQKHGPKPAKAPLQPIPVTPVPFNMVGIDLIGPIVRSTGKKGYVLSMIDYATRFPDCVVIPNKSVKCVAIALMKMFSRVGFPKIIISDQETSFMSGMLNEMYEIMGIKARHSTPYHPQCNGLVENFQKTLKSMIYKFVDSNKKDWDKFINVFLFAYRQAPHKTTKFSPFDLIYGHEVRGPLNILRDSWIEKS